MPKKKPEEVINQLLTSYPDVRQTLSISPTAVTKLLTEYIDHHKWLINEKIPYPITLEQAFHSWYENVFQPQIYAMKQTGVFRIFPRTLSVQLFDDISKIHYQHVNEEERYVPYEAACYAYICKNSRSRVRRYFACRAIKEYYSL